MIKKGLITISVVALVAPLIVGCSTISPVSSECRTYAETMDVVAVWISENPDNLSQDEVMYGAMKYLQQELPTPKFTSLATLAGQYASAIEDGDTTRKNSAAQSFLEATAPFDAECR